MGWKIVFGGGDDMADMRGSASKEIIVILL